ncbi:YebC/PmpR family DNA-binding transcriptional regulator [Clostridium formicaceticum]|uniref:Probable transcriptional regulatory protein BJL90_13755 n=1 Tax=Clostridium formicaceticum TaxID=1497 RepID=A0AAC9RL32_9CLOT|nr:YebC/PmpR family DNA-binding transcriptional regulator [Clostridium formicaceticum]AOY76824.1 transcriptional regulator [Clostridium formicaceticum]ARE87295.1 Transcriptional regulatory protein PmpR [Clostridium formicaceticum]
MGRIGNIKDRKAKQDSKRAKIYTKLARLITVAAREGGTDPEYNASLKSAIDKAKAGNMPNDNIDRAIKKAAGDAGGDKYENIIYEGYGPSGVAVVVEALTDNRNRTAGEVRHAFDKNGGNLGTTGCVSFMFDRKGQIIIEKTDAIDEETLMMAALDAGAEDFIAEEEAYEVITLPEDFPAVKDKLLEEGYNFIEADIVYIPQTQAELQEADAKKMEKLIDMLEDNDDVQAVHYNWKEA